MVFETTTGETGIFVGTNKGLWMLFKRGTHTKYDPEMLTVKMQPTRLKRITEGMNRLGYFGIPEYHSQAFDKSDIVWELGSEGIISFELTPDYTATVKGDSIEVGCQTISVSKVRELLAKIDNASRIGKQVRFCDVRVGEVIRFGKNAYTYRRIECNPTKNPPNSPCLWNIPDNCQAYCDPNNETMVTIVG